MPLMPQKYIKVQYALLPSLYAYVTVEINTFLFKRCIWEIFREETIFAIAERPKLL